MDLTTFRSRVRVAVIGPHEAKPEELALGREVGRHLAEAGAILICGGLGGIMEAAAAGAKSAGGLTIGILPGDTSDAANPYIDLPLPTGLGVYRNVLVVRAADAVIAVGGRYGTLTEMAYALRLDVPVVALRSWSLAREGRADPQMKTASNPKEAVQWAIQQAHARKKDLSKAR